MDHAGVSYMTTWLGQHQHQQQVLAAAGAASLALHHHHHQTSTPHAGHRMSSSSAGDVYCQQSEYTKEEPLSMYEQDEGDQEDSQQGRDGGSRSHSTPLTLKWLNDNYEIADGVCIPRSTLYQHYLDFSEKADIIPVNAASFGKIIRQQFPQITTRRLGTRGQSKYHYYGIGVKETSPYYDYIYSKAGQQQSMHNGSNGKKEVCKQVPLPYSPRSRIGTLLPDFPSVAELKLPDEVPTEKVLTFVMMYRTHCQRILDTVIRANFDEVQNFLLHFWQGMPPHMMPILDLQPIVSLVAVCDCILYRSISSVLTPNVLQALPESLTQIIRKFAKQLRGWMQTALVNLPESLRSMKFKVARQFTKILTLQVSLNHLCQASRTVMQSGDVLVQMLNDWRSVDKASISKQTLYMLGDIQPLHIDKELDRMLKFYNEFELLLQGQCQIEAYIQWLDRMIDVCVVKPGLEQARIKRKISRNFLLVWSCFGTRIIRDMTLHSSPSFGSFHLLHLMFDDYILYHMELLHCQDMTDGLMRQIRGEPVTDTADPKDELNATSSECSTMASLSAGSRAPPAYANAGQPQRSSGVHRDRFVEDSVDSPADHKPVCRQRNPSAPSQGASENYGTSPGANVGATYGAEKMQQHNHHHEQFYRCPSALQQQHQQHQFHGELAHNWRAAAAAAAAAAASTAAPVPPGQLLQHYHPCYQPTPMMSMGQPFLPYAALGAPHFPMDTAAINSYQAYAGMGGDYCQAKGMKRPSETSAAAAAAVAAASERIGACSGLPTSTSMDMHNVYVGGKRFHHHQMPDGASSSYSFVDGAPTAYAMT